MESKFSGLKAFALGAAAAVAGVGLAVGANIIKTAVEFEKLEATLVTIEGSAEKARESLDWVSDFAAKTPFQLEEVSRAFVKLKAFGLEPTNGLLRTLGDTASAMGKSIDQAVEAIADAVTGENERLKEFGIKARAEGDTLVYEYTQNGRTMTKSAKKSSREQIQAVLESIFNEKYKGAMQRQSRTFAGLMSNLQDQWTRFAVKFAEKTGVFEFTKRVLKGLLDQVNAFIDDGGMDRLIGAFNTLKKILKDSISVINDVANAMGGWQEILELLSIALGVFVAIKIAAFLATVPAMVAGFMAEAAAAGALATAINLIPGAAVLTAITLAIAFLIKLFVDWAQGQPGIIQNILGPFDEFVDNFKTGFNNLKTIVTAWVTDYIAKWQLAGLKTKLWARGVDQTIMKMVKGIQKWFENGIGSIGKFIDKISDGARKLGEITGLGSLFGGGRHNLVAAGAGGGSVSTNNISVKESVTVNVPPGTSAQQSQAISSQVRKEVGKVLQNEIRQATADHGGV